MMKTDYDPAGPMTLAQIAVERHHAGHNAWELGMLLDIVAKTVKPKLILEIGSDRGGSLYAWASIGAQVVAVTLAETKDFLEDGHTYGAEMIYGNSHDDDMPARIREVLGDRTPDMAFIDGDHTEAGCTADLDLCITLGIPVIAIHDICSIPAVALVWGRARKHWPHVLIERVRRDPISPGAGILWLT
jgi:predicted O-methyltransferase YrrM